MIVNVTPQFGASLTVINNAPSFVSFAPNIFIKQATGRKGLWETNAKDKKNNPECLSLANSY
jgi:hypothetical protein